MSTNKHATIRYNSLDRCFSNFGRRYYMEDLIEACNNALYEFTGIKNGIKRRQVFDDIKFMESEQGFSIPLEHYKDGKKVFYRYSEKGFSIKTQNINETEVKQLKETLSILIRFKGMPQFEWVEEMLVRLESTFGNSGRSEAFVGFEQNPYLKGLHYFTELFNAIQYKQVLGINYKGFKQVKAEDILFHPYYLKQYNSRWFLFGLNDKTKSISNLALDRILKIKPITKKYVINDTIDFEEFFEDAIGVSIDPNKEPVKIILEIGKELWPYIESKPIHGSQKVKSKNDESVTIQLHLLLNYELISRIFSLGEGIKVIAPEALKQAIKTKAEAVMGNYL